MDPDLPHFGNLDPQQIKIRIRISDQSDKLDLKRERDPLQFADDKRKCMEYEPILAIFQGFKSLSGS